MKRIATKKIILESGNGFVRFTDINGVEKEVLATATLKAEHFEFNGQNIWFLDIGDGPSSFKEI